MSPRCFMTRRVRHEVPGLLALAIVLQCATLGLAADWPQWRYDAQRGAATEQQLASELHLQWVRKLPALQTAWPDQAKMVFDRAYEPVVMGQQMFVGSSRTDSVTAYDTRSGNRNWIYYSEGPVRFAPIAYQGKVYFVSDDSYLYCLDAADGSLAWKYRGGPSDRKNLGNGRLISTWPARGGPVLADDTIYFAASIWPSMGIFVHAVDAKSGKRVWTNDGEGANYVLQPHGAYSFAGVCPQGALCVAGDKIMVPGGRSVPACFDRKTGRQLYFKHGPRGGGTQVFAVGSLFVNNGLAYEAENGEPCGAIKGPICFNQQSIYTADSDSIQAKAFPTIKVSEGKDKRGKKRTVRKMEFDKEQFTVKAPSVDELIRAGSRFYGAKDHKVFAVDLPDENSGNKASKDTWQTEVEGRVVRLVAADDRLFAITLEGSIYCFGAEKAETARHSIETQEFTGSEDQQQQAARILKNSGVNSGYCVLWGVGDGGLAAELVRQSDLQVVVIDDDAETVSAARERFAQADLFGSRVSLLVGNADSVRLPPYMATLMVVTQSDKLNDAVLEKVYRSLRPYGGVLCFDIDDQQRKTIAQSIERLGLTNAEVRTESDLLLVSRVGALPGSANWTHEHADASNTRVSADSLVKAPLGMLWFGGPTHEPILPRHGHGPQPQVVDGRLIIEGPDLLRCLDIYTGRVLWQRELPGVGALYDNTGHHPGANGTGANYISHSGGIYVLYGKVCLRLDPATGKTLGEFRLPVEAALKDSPELCYINVKGDALILGADVTRDKIDKDNKDYKKLTFERYISCERLAVLDRVTGKLRWSIDADFQFRNNAICTGGGRLYCIDLLSDRELLRLKRRGEQPTRPSRLLALDLQSGKPLWLNKQKVFGTWLSYSREYELLFEAGRPGRDVLSGEPGGIRAIRAADGSPLWQTGDAGPAMVYGDRILNATGKALDILTGKQSQRIDPISGASKAWDWRRNYGCNTPQASKHLMLFRSGATGFYDLSRDGGTGNFGGFRSSCTNNLIVAGGVLSAPDYTRTCSCAYQNQTSVGLVHMPEEELWTFTPFKFDKDQPVLRLGVNLGAPGDRRTDEGTLWIDHPSTGGDSPEVPIEMTGDKLNLFRHHASRITAGSDDAMPWVAASGAIGLKKLVISLGSNKKKTARKYLVRLHFAEVEDCQPGERVFGMAIDGKTVLEKFDIAKAAKGTNRAVVQQFQIESTAEQLEIAFTAIVCEPLLCGVEIVAEP